MRFLNEQDVQRRLGHVHFDKFPFRGCHKTPTIQCRDAERSVVYTVGWGRCWESGEVEGGVEKEVGDRASSERESGLGKKTKTSVHPSHIL